MTDEQLDAIIDRAKPDFRIAIRSVLEGQGCHMFVIGQQTVAEGVQWTIECSILSEPIARMAEALLQHGLPAMSASYAKVAIAKAKAAGLTSSLPNGVASAGG